MAEEFNLSIYNDVYDMSFNQETEEIHIELKEGYYPLSNNGDLSNCYTKPQSDSRYKSINYVPNWGSIGGNIENQADLIQKFGNYYNKNEVDSLISNIDVDVDLSNYYTKPQSDARFKSISYTPNWSEVSGKPTTFTPSAHTHTISEVINLQSTLDNKEDKLNAVNLGEILDTQLSIKMTPSADDEIVILDSITGDAATVKFSSFGGNVATSNLVPYTGATQDLNIGAHYFESSAGFKTPNGTPNKALTSNGGTFDLNLKVDKVTGKQLSSEDYTTVEKTKLSGIEVGANNYTHPTGDGYSHIPATSTTNNGKVLKAGATANSANWSNVDWSEIANKPATFMPATHTHAISEVTNLQTSLDAKVSTLDVVTTATANKLLKLDVNAKLPASITGNADGNAATATKLQTARTINGVNFDGSANITINAVDSTARIASSEKGAINGVATLDSTGKVPSSQLPSYVDDVLEFANLASFPATGESGKIYIAIDTNLTYRWGGSSYVVMSSSLALGETESTAYRGDRGKIAYDHSQITSGNPHGTTKNDIGLGNVDNTSDVNKPISLATQNALNLKANKGLNIKITTPSNLVTGTLAETEVLRIEIPANSLSASDVLRIPFLIVSKIGTNGTMSIRGKLSTSPTMPSVTTDQLFQFLALPATNQYVGLDRSFVIDGGQIKGIHFAINVLSSISNSNSPLASKAFDRTVTNYLYVSIQLFNTADQARLEGMQLTNS